MAPVRKRKDRTSKEKSSDSTAKKKRTDLTLEQKIDAIRDYDKNPSVRKIAKKYKCGKSTISDILKLREELFKLYEENKNLSGHHVTRALTEDNLKIDQLVWEWFAACRSKSLPLSGPLICQKAGFFAKELGINNFGGADGMASPGWLYRWKSRHNVVARVISGESASVDQEIVDNFRLRVPMLTAGFAPKDVFNADETGLFFRALPDRSLVQKGESCKGGKQAKERITLLFCASQTGEKLKPFVIGKAEKPRCFRNLEKGNLPVTWRANRKAWMTSALFEDFINGFNRLMRRQNRKVLLFIDNAPSHPADFELSNVTVKFFPPNTTSHLQPLDQGVIRAFKAHYRKRILQELLSRLDSADSASDLAKKITVLDAVMWSAQAWKNVSNECIQNCFSKAGFEFDDRNEPPEIIDSDEPNDGNIFDLMNRYAEVVPAAAGVGIDDFLSFDDPLTTDISHGTIVDDIANEILGRHKEEVMAAENGESLVEDDEIEEMESIEYGNRLSQLDILKFFEGMKAYSLTKAPALYEHVASLESKFSRHFIEVAVAKMKQTTLDSFFQK